jgi:hypothetical protein
MCDIYLAQPIVAIFIRTPFEIRTSLADLGFAICRVVTDLTPDYPSFRSQIPIYLTIEAAGLRKRVHFSLPARSSLWRNPRPVAMTA